MISLGSVVILNIVDKEVNHEQQLYNEVFLPGDTQHIKLILEYKKLSGQV